MKSSEEAELLSLDTNAMQSVSESAQASIIHALPSN
jgi:hypothetical protein